MRKNKTALILSLIYCGLGQIYKGQKLKGISFFIGYTILIVSLIFRPYFSVVIYLSVIFVILLIWLMGMVDAYIDDDDPIGVEQNPIWRKLEPIIEFSVILSVLAAIFIVTYPGFDYLPPIKNPVEKTAGNINKPKSETIPDIKEEFYIQVAALKNYDRAIELHNFIISKGFPAKIEYQPSSEDKLYHVLVGSFKTRNEAISLAEKVNKHIGLNYIIVSRPINP